MDTNMKYVASRLNDLIGICRSEQEELRLAAASVANSQIRVILREFSRQRGDMADELQAHVVQLGQQPAMKKHAGIPVYCDWVFMKLAVDPHNEPAIIDQCQRCDAVTLDAYKNILHSELPPVTHALIKRQYVVVRATHNRIHSLERVLATNS